MISVFRPAAAGATALLAAAALYGCGDDGKGKPSTAASTSTGAAPPAPGLPRHARPSKTSTKIAACLRASPGYAVTELWTDLDSVAVRATDGAVGLFGDGWSAMITVERTEAEAVPLPDTYKVAPDNERPSSAIRTGRIVVALYGKPGARSAKAIDDCTKDGAGPQ